MHHENQIYSSLSWPWKNICPLCAIKITLVVISIWHPDLSFCQNLLPLLLDTPWTWLLPSMPLRVFEEGLRLRRGPTTRRHPYRVFRNALKHDWAAVKRSPERMHRIRLVNMVFMIELLFKNWKYFKYIFWNYISSATSIYWDLNVMGIKYQQDMEWQIRKPLQEPNI